MPTCRRPQPRTAPSPARRGPPDLLRPAPVGRTHSRPFRPRRRRSASRSQPGPSRPRRCPRRLRRPATHACRDGRSGANGTGLGLSIVRETVEALRGRAWAEFRDGMSIFAFSLPVRRATDPSAPDDDDNAEAARMCGASASSPASAAHRACPHPRAADQQRARAPAHRPTRRARSARRDRRRASRASSRAKRRTAPDVRVRPRTVARRRAHRLAASAPRASA